NIFYASHMDSLKLAATLLQESISDGISILEEYPTNYGLRVLTLSEWTESFSESKFVEKYKLIEVIEQTIGCLKRAEQANKLIDQRIAVLMEIKSMQ
ncbi:MAG: hypothetical protein AAF206_28615, partial [Bacteroidota bacterium]